jgi:hypothetical protein
MPVPLLDLLEQLRQLFENLTFMDNWRRNIASFCCADWQAFIDGMYAPSDRAIK